MAPRRPGGRPGEMSSQAHIEEGERLLAGVYDELGIDGHGATANYLLAAQAHFAAASAIEARRANLRTPGPPPSGRIGAGVPR